MKNTILLIASLCCVALCLNVVAVPEPTVLRQDSGKNFSEMNLTLFSTVSEFGLNGLDIGEAVKFTAPKAGWKLQGVQVLGWSGFNNTTQTLSVDRNFLVEIRDKDLNLIYKFADMQNNYFISTTGPVIGVIETPALPLTGDFYVVFYDRGAMGVAMEDSEGTGNSFLYINGLMEPAERTVTETNESIKINWLIDAFGN